MAQPTPKIRTGHPYAVIQGKICRTTPKASAVPLCNFAAIITEEITLDDGVGLKRQYRIEGQLDDGTVLPTATVSATEFADVITWTAREWGSNAIVSSHAGSAIREAIQQFSNATERRIYTHTGWREIQGKLGYLYQGGAVGTSDVSVQLDPPLDRAVLPEQVYAPAEALRCSLKLLDCGPASVIIPLLGSIYLAPLTCVLEPDFGLYLTGPTGSLKSELAALAQGHFGQFDRKHLPASWSSTENAIELIVFTLKDMLAVIDDFAPQANRQDQARIQQVAERVIRSIGNRSARARLRPDLTRHADRPPRGLVLVTGEQLPEGSSINARLVVVEVNRQELNLDAITEVQQLAGRFPHAMRAYIEWLAPVFGNVKVELERARNRLRDWFRGAGTHLRQPESLAQLALGLACFLQFAEEHGAIGTGEADAIWALGCKSLLQIGHREAEHLQNSDPAEKFFRTLVTLLAQGAVHLAQKDQRAATDTNTPTGELIGWRDSENVYLLPDASKKAIAGFLDKAGEHWTTTTRALGEILQRNGYLVTAADGRPQKQIRVEGKRYRVFQIPIVHLFGPDEAIADEEGGVVQDQQLPVSDVPERPRLSGDRKAE